jgi:hypothetical protein
MSDGWRATANKPLGALYEVGDAVLVSDPERALLVTVVGYRIKPRTVSEFVYAITYSLEGRERRGTLDPVKAAQDGTHLARWTGSPEQVALLLNSPDLNAPNEQESDERPQP